jgi:hypothetical protein
MYSQFLGSLHPDVEELQDMARTARKQPKVHLKPLIDLMGLPGACRRNHCGGGKLK